MLLQVRSVAEIMPRPDVRQGMMVRRPMKCQQTAHKTSLKESARSAAKGSVEWLAYQSVHEAKLAELEA